MQDRNADVKNQPAVEIVLTLYENLESRNKQQSSLDLHFYKNCFRSQNSSSWDKLISKLFQYKKVTRC